MSVEAVQDKVIDVVVELVLARLVGVEGGVVSAAGLTVTVALLLFEPPPPVQDKL